MLFSWNFGLYTLEVVLKWMQVLVGELECIHCPYKKDKNLRGLGRIPWTEYVLEKKTQSRRQSLRKKLLQSKNANVSDSKDRLIRPFSYDGKWSIAWLLLGWDREFRKKKTKVHSVLRGRKCWPLFGFIPEIFNKSVMSPQIFPELNKCGVSWWP